MTWASRDEKKKKTPKHFNRDIRESGIIKCRLNMDKFTAYFKTLWIDTNWEHKTVTVTARMILK